MKKSILEIYAMAICFVAVVVFAVSLGTGLYSIVEIANPELTMNSWDWERYQSNDIFFLQMPHQYNEKGNRPKREDFDEEKLTQKREDAFKLSVNANRREAIQSLIRTMLILFVSVLVFIPHWTLAKRSRES